ncbi:MAG: flagellar biosynthesis protein FliQ [Oscillospiraceae bacterium]|nr:flagellar biosynthesis protein FliQ [Oscillospiraceae bacterium]MBP1556652.1 flagellar biosynthesis protein FliQ [Oscillospiraceae bacterium]MBP1577574.1 flagellar biosynthesis protein FliQ [Oscillospiraceae bacterium]
MTSDQVLDIFSQALLVAMKLAMPMLLVSIAVGLLVAIFQAATQIHEQTLTFVPKLLVIAVLLLLTGSWMISVMNDFVHWLFSVILTI